MSIASDRSHPKGHSHEQLQSQPVRDSATRNYALAIALSSFSLPAISGEPTMADAGALYATTSGIPDTNPQQQDPRLSGHYTRVNSPSDFIARAGKDSNLYVQGSVDISESSLQELGSWLKSNHPHTFLYVLDSAAGMSFVDSERRTYRGWEAVFYEVHDRIFNNDQIGSLRSEHGNLPDAKVFALVLTPNDRKFMYWSSEFQQRYGVGHAEHWPDSGKALMTPFRAQFERGRMVNGIKDTFDNIAKLEKEGVQSELNSAARNEMIKTTGLWGGIGLVAAIGAGAAFTRRRRSNAKKAEVAEKLDDWQKFLDEKEDGLSQTYMRFQSLVRKNDGHMQAFEGKSAEIAEVARTGLSKMFQLRNGAEREVVKAKESLQAGRWYSYKLYDQVLSDLTEKPIQLSKSDKLACILKGKELTPEEILLAGRNDLADREVRFETLLDEFQQHATTAVDAIKTLEKAKEKTLGRLSAAEKELAGVREQGQKLQQAGNTIFPLEKLEAQVFVPLDTQLKAALRTFFKNPVEAYDQSEQIFDTLKDVADALKSIGDFYEHKLPRITAQREAIMSPEPVLGKVSSIRPQWINEQLAELSVQVGNFLEGALTRSYQFSAADLQHNFEAVAKDVETAYDYDVKRRNKTGPRIDETRSHVEKAREELSALHEVPAEKILGEEHADPGRHLRNAKKHLAASAEALTAGDLQACASSLETIDSECQAVEVIVSKTREAAAGYAERLSARKSAAENLAPQKDTSRGLIGSHSKLLEEIAATYSPSVLTITPSDVQRSGSNGSIQDNITEANASFLAATKAVENAETCFAQGKFLQAGDELVRGERLHLDVSLRLREIVDKKERLERCEKENAEDLDNLSEVRAELSQLAEDRRTSEPSIALLSEAEKNFVKAEKLQGKEKRNPFAIAERLEEIERTFRDVRVQIKRDWDLHEEVLRSITAAEKRLDSAGAHAREAANDSIADSPELKEAYADIPKLRESLNRLGREVQHSSHGNWAEFDVRADKLFESATAVIGVIKAEVNEGEQTSQALATAKQAIRSATNYRGDYAQVNGSPWADEMREGVEHFSAGDYDSAKAFFAKAKKEADSALRAAKEREQEAQDAAEAEAAAEAAAALASALLRSSSSSTRSFSSSPFSSPSSGSYRPSVSPMRSSLGGSIGGGFSSRGSGGSVGSF